MATLIIHLQATMHPVKLRFLKKQQETGDIWSFFFEPPADLTWVAGQSIRLEIPRLTFGVDEKRFTISSAPYEKVVRITTRLSSSTFKQSLDKLSPDDEINAFGVEGDFVWSDDKPKLWLAGGIGVTPFRSMLLQAIHDQRPVDIMLVHSFHDEQIFDTEFNKFTKNYPLKDQRISAEWLEANLPDWKNRQVYISGPEKMVMELSKQLKDAGLPDIQIKLDLFTGNFYG